MKTYAVVMTSWGEPDKAYLKGLTYKQAVFNCEACCWKMESIDGSFIWDLSVREETNDEMEVKKCTTLK